MKITERIFDAITGTTTDIDRDETAEETASRLKHEAKVAFENQTAKDKELARQAIYTKLGLTADEVAALLG
jgi:hypothetical protein